MIKEEKDFALKKAQGYKNDALFWIDKANTHYQIFSALITTISITALGYITLFFPKDLQLSLFEKLFFIFIIISSAISVFAALWQNYIDQLYFVYLSGDSSKRQIIWENKHLTEVEKEFEVIKLGNTNPKSKTIGLNIQVCCLIILIICFLVLGISRLMLNTSKFNKNNFKNYRHDFKKYNHSDWIFFNKHY